MGRTPQEPLRADRIAAFLQRRGYANARIIRLQPLGESGVSSKSYGYGKPLRILFEAADGRHELVLRTMSPDRFGHERLGDRFETFVLAREDFPRIPRHIQPVAMGVVDGDGSLHPLAVGEPFLLTEYVDGTLYAGDVQNLADGDTLTDLDRERARALAAYLAGLHSRVEDAEYYCRHVRDVTGSGEGIFGLCESYLRCEDSPLTPSDLEWIEQRAVHWRWRLLQRPDRARRGHGDFHPFNLLFRSGTDFTVLDCSRGGRGDPADDMCCLTINYLFFGLMRSPHFNGPCRELWNLVWQDYLDATGDVDMLGLVAPYFAWRGLVLASPIWYPHVDEAVRESLLSFIRALLEGAPFDPRTVETLL